MAELAQRYERVVFDSPPVGAVTDALVLAPSVDGVVFVGQADTTSIAAAQQARRALQDVGTRFFGVILNDVDLSRQGYRGYYPYYHYGSGYTTEPEPAAAHAHGKAK
jgi:Mrp family chromosome partitioning ATPase